MVTIGPRWSVLTFFSEPHPRQFPFRRKQTRNNARASHHNGMGRAEQAFFKICERAASASEQFHFLGEQRSHGWSNHFPTSWKNALGSLTERAMKAFLFSWKRWETHTTKCQLYWKGRSLFHALFLPSVGQFAHYLGERSMSGLTAAAGAHTSIAVWCKFMRTHQPTRQIPIDVAVMAHFQYILESTASLYSWLRSALTTGSPWQA